MMLQPQINSARLAPMETMQRVGVIHLTNGGFTVVDPERVDELNKRKWRRGTKGYVVSSNGFGKKVLRMHRVIMEAKDGQQIDHRNRVRVDNRIGNLRVATSSQNVANSTKREGQFSSQYKGVAWHKGAWRALIVFQRKHYHLGRFQSEIEAARVYNAAALERFGEFARLNEIP